MSVSATMLWQAFSSALIRPYLLPVLPQNRVLSGCHPSGGLALPCTRSDLRVGPSHVPLPLPGMPSLELCDWSLRVPSLSTV